MIIEGFDSYNLCLTGDVGRTLATPSVGLNEHIPIIVLNFQGSKSNNATTEDGTSYSLNAMHGHDVHVVCFEPGIARREGSDGKCFPICCGMP